MLAFNLQATSFNSSHIKLVLQDTTKIWFCYWSWRPLSELVEVPDLMNFERKFGRIYFDSDLQKARNGANGNSKGELLARIKYALRPQMRAHYPIALVAALPAIGSSGFLFFTKFDTYPIYLIAGLTLFISGLLVDYRLRRKKSEVDGKARQVYQEMIKFILG